MYVRTYIWRKKEKETHQTVFSYQTKLQNGIQDFYQQSKQPPLGLPFSWLQRFMTEDHATRGPLLTSPQGANFEPRCEVVPQGWILYPGGEVIPWGWNFLFVPPLFYTIESVRTWGRGWRNGWTFPLGDKFYPRGQSSPWGPGVKLRIALRLPHDPLPSTVSAQLHNWPV
jgi:hypothetical protein